MEISKLIEIAAADQYAKKFVSHLIKTLGEYCSGGISIFELKMEKKRASKKEYSISIVLKINPFLLRTFILIVLSLLFR